MEQIQKRIVLIPAYMPDEKLLGVVDELADKGFEIVVVNDGSGSAYDGLFELVKEKAAVLDHPQNRGKGAALKTGLKFISENYEAPYIVATADADGQHKTEDIAATADEAAVSRSSLVLGSRSFDKDVPLRSRFGNTVTRGVFRLCSGVKVYDTQTGLRAFSDKLIELMLHIGGERYEYEMNVLMELSKRRVPIREHHIETVYLDGNSSSHFDTLRDSARIYRSIFSYVFGSRRKVSSVRS